MFAIFPPSLGSLVGQIREKRNPSRAIRNKDRKSLSCRSQEAGEASHQDHSVLALFPGHLPMATGIGINYPAVVLYVIATPENNTHGCRTKTPATQKRASFRVSNESTIFHDLTPLKKKRKKKAVCHMATRVRGDVTLPQPKQYFTHHILLGCIFVALQNTDSVFVAHVLDLFHRVVSKFLEQRNRSLYFTVFYYLCISSKFYFH